MVWCESSCGYSRMIRVKYAVPTSSWHMLASVSLRLSSLFLFFFSLFLLLLPLSRAAQLLLVEGCLGLFCLHFWWSKCPFLAVVLVNSAPQSGQLALAACPDFSRWWRRRLLKVENWRPLQPCSQH